MTAYRQDALRCLKHLNQCGPSKAADVAARTGVARARAIMYADHYGWFEREGGGVYRLSQKGVEAFVQYPDEMDALR